MSDFICPDCGDTVERNIRSESVYSEAWGIGKNTTEDILCEAHCDCGFWVDEGEETEDLEVTTKADWNFFFRELKRKQEA